MTDIPNEEAREKVREILAAHGIKMSIGGCGCCGSPWVSLEHNGQRYTYETLDLNMIEPGQEQK